MCLILRNKFVNVKMGLYDQISCYFLLKCLQVTALVTKQNIHELYFILGEFMRTSN